MGHFTREVRTQKGAGRAPNPLFYPGPIPLPTYDLDPVWAQFVTTEMEMEFNIKKKPKTKPKTGLTGLTKDVLHKPKIAKLNNKFDDPNIYLLVLLKNDVENQKPIFQNNVKA